ncbi:MAG: hypothetical protein HDS29_05900 [Bacteroides sp.]|nr:hypothetical protein [Bacteroides sp.]
MEYPIHYGLEKAGLPLILTAEDPKNLCFLIDTGSTRDVIFDFVYQHFKDYFTLTDETQNIMGIDGSLKPTIIVNADLRFDDLRYKAPFAVLEANDAITQVQAETGIQIHGVLGIPFLIENKCLIDFDKLTISNK